MGDFNLAYLGVIIPMVAIFSCCVIGVICGKCKTGGGRNGGNATGTNTGVRHYNHRSRNHGFHSNHVYTIDTGNCGSYGGGFGGGDFGGSCGGDGGGCGGDAGGFGV